MASIKDLVSLFKQGAITKEDLLKQIGEVDSKSSDAYQHTDSEEELKPRRPPSMSSKAESFSSKADPFERLYYTKSNVYSALKEKEDLVRMQKELENCTFRPKINPKSESIKSKFLEAANRHHLVEETDHSFVPKVKGANKDMKTAKAYLKHDPFERLYQRNGPYESEEDSNFNPDQEYARHMSVYSQPDGFLERQSVFEEQRKQKIEEMKKPPPRTYPKINKKSEELARGNFYERNNEFIEKYNIHKKEIENALLEECTFKPKITKKGKELKSRSAIERCYGDSVKQEEKIKILKESAQQKESYSFKPTSYAQMYENVDSKLKVNSDPQTYMERLMLEKAEKEEIYQKFRNQQIVQEMRECTHSPAIINAPSYIKQMAKKPKKVSSVTTPSKPEWR